MRRLHSRWPREIGCRMCHQLRIGQYIGKHSLRWPFVIALGGVACAVSIGYIGLTRIQFAPVTASVGIVLLLLNFYTWTLYLRRFRHVRPAKSIVRTAKVCFYVGLGVWIPTSLLAIEITVSPSERWSIGGGVVRNEVYVTRTARFMKAPAVHVQLDPTWFPFSVGVPSVALVHCRDGSSTWLEWPIFGLVLSSGFPMLLLVRLRRQRAKALECRRCGYDLQGNVSGICPECGTPIETDRCQPAKEEGYRPPA